MIITFYVGIGFDADGVPMEVGQVLRDAALDIVSKAFGGATLTDGFGAWEEYGKSLKEPTLVFSTDGPNPVAMKTAEKLRILFNQRAVYFTAVEGRSVYVSGQPVAVAA